MTQIGRRSRNELAGCRPVGIDLWQIAGAGAVVAGTTAIGRMQARRFSQRPLELRQLAALLRALRSDIAFLRTPLPEALRRASRLTRDPPLRSLFADTAVRLEEAGVTAAGAFAEALGNYAEQSALTAEDREILWQWSRNVGLTGREEQLAHLDAALALLDGRENEAIAQRARYEKVYQTAGILAGILIVILLI